MLRQLLITVADEVATVQRSTGAVVIKADVCWLYSQWQSLTLTGHRPRPAITNPLGDVLPQRASSRATRLQQTHGESQTTTNDETSLRLKSVLHH